MTVYVVIAQNADPAWIQGVYTDKQKALKQIPENKPNYHGLQIEEVILDE